MKNLTEGILNYQNMSSTGALMISGEWGCGKTYHLKHVVFPELRKQGIRPLYISLFGIKDIGEIPMRLLEAGMEYLATDGDEGSDKTSFLTGLLAKGGKTLSSIKWITDKVDIEKILSTNSDIFYNLIPVKKSILFLDDLERVLRTKTIDFDTLLGSINNLVEQRGYKVVVIANNTYVEGTAKDKLTFKEKVIEKTLVYEPDVVEIYKEICSGDEYNENFRDFMLQVDYVNIIDPRCYAYHDNEDQKKDMRNIRILKFAISHYSKVYEQFSDVSADEKYADYNEFMLTLWAVTYGLALKYKKNLLTYNDREQYVGYVEIPDMNIQLGDDDSDPQLFNEEENAEEGDKKETNKQLASRNVNHLYKVFVKEHSLPVITFPPLFDFMTAGVDLDRESMLSIWKDYRASEERNKLSPAYALLSQFMRSQWNMSNDEMEAALKQLAKYVEDGEFNDNMAYVNSATYLQHMLSITPFSQKDIERKIKNGIDKFYKRVTKLNLIDKMNIDVVANEIPQISCWVIEYEKAKMEDVTSNNLHDDIAEACRQFNEDLPALSDRITVQYNSTATPDFASYPILKHIKAKDIQAKVNNIQPKEVMALYYILNSRFEVLVNDSVCQEELAFVKVLRNAIRKRKVTKKRYSDILIEDHLVKMIDKILPKK